MKSNKELNNDELDNVSGGGKNLEDYLKTVVEHDKNKILVDEGTGKQLDINPSIDINDDGNLIIVKREKGSQENKTDL